MKCIVGIGNPGREYQKTRHNVGFRVIDALKKSATALKKEKVLLVKPSTYVNRTGEAVSQLFAKYKVAIPNILVVCDDVNLDFGKIRLRAKGSAGGHKGLLSVISAFGNEEFARLRIGVRTERMPKDLASFVLEPFSKIEEAALKNILEKAVAVCETWANEGIDAAQNVLNQSSKKDT